MVAAATDNGTIGDPLVRQGLATYYTKIQLLRINGLRSLSATLSGAKDLGVAALGAHEQDVLDRDAQGGDGAHPRHPRRVVDADRHRPRVGFMAGRGTRQASTPATRSAR